MSNTITLTIQLNAQGAEGIVQKLVTDLKKINTAAEGVKPAGNILESTVGKIAGNVALIGAGYAAIKFTLASWVAGSNDTEAAAASLTQALKQQGLYTQSTIEDLQAYAGELLQLTGIDDDLLVKTMAQLTAMGLTGNELKRATRLAADLSAVMGTDIQSAARVMADAFEGNASMLGRYIKGLDQADIKQRGAISIMEQLEKAVGGQAEALGSTGAGAMRVFNEEIHNLEDALGELVKKGMLPVISVLGKVVNALTNSSNSMKIFVISGAVLISMFTVLGSSINPLWYGIVGLASGILLLVNGIREGNPWFIALGTILTAILGTIAIFKVTAMVSGLYAMLTAAISTTEGLSVLEAKIIELDTLLAANPWTLIIGGLIALGVELGIFLHNQSKAQEEFQKTFNESIQRMSDGMKKEILALSSEQIKPRLEFEISSAEEQLKKIRRDIMEAKAAGKSDDDLESLFQSERVFEARLKTAKELLVEVDASNKKIANSTAIAIEIDKARVDAMIEGTQKQIAMARIAYREDVERIEQRKKSTGQDRINDEQAKALQTAAATKLKNTLIAIDREQYDKQQEELIRFNARKRDIDEESAVLAMKTEKQVSDLRKQQLRQRINDLEILGPLTIEQETELLQKRLDLRRIETDEAKKAFEEKRELTYQLQELEINSTTFSLDAVENEHQRALALIELRYQKEFELAKENAVKLRILEKEKNIELRVENETYLKQMADRQAQYYEDINNMFRETFREAWNLLRSSSKRNTAQMENDYELYKIDQDKRTASLRESLNKGEISQREYQLTLRQMEFEQRQKESELNEARMSDEARFWNSLKDKAWDVIGSIVEKWIEGEVLKTEATQSGVASRLVAVGSEILGSLASAGAAIVDAIAEALRWIFTTVPFPFSLAVAGGAIASIGALYAGVKQSFGFEQGGEFLPGQSGFIEGTHAEIIAPKRNFLEVFQNDVMPVWEHYIGRSIPQLQMQLSGVGNSNALIAEIQMLRRDLNKKNISVNIKTTLDEFEVVKRNLPKSQRAIELKRQ